MTNKQAYEILKSAVVYVLQNERLEPDQYLTVQSNLMKALQVAQAALPVDPAPEVTTLEKEV